MTRFLILGLLWPVVFANIAAGLKCENKHCDGPEWFCCDRTKCVSRMFVCDGDIDCEDQTDEQNCENHSEMPPVNVTCAEDEWMCQDKICIPQDWVCNGQPECLDASDETLGCSLKIPCDGFKCNNNHCIPKEWRCDGANDCVDNSDEIGCDAFISPNDCNTDTRHFMCKDNSKCIKLGFVCDSSVHCPDGSDEGPNCTSSNNCSNRNCSHACYQSPAGPRCLCPEGYHQIEEQFCKDINECEKFGICDQKCRNTDGSYSCYCDAGYVLQPDNTCKAEGGEALLVFSTRTEIRGYFLSSETYFPMVKNLKHAIGVDFDGHFLYWTDISSSSESIIKSNEDGSQRELVVTSGLATPEDLAVDWITGNIYFTDADLKHIGVCTNNGIHCTVIVNADIDQPRAIVLHPEAGLMYWSDWGAKPEIGRSKMDGSEDVSFVSENIHWPNGVVIDYPNDRLYWVDAKLMTVETISLDGTGRKIILSGIVKHPYSIAVFENKLYWADWHLRSISSCDKFTGKNHKTIVKELVYDIHVFHSTAKRQVKNPCSGSPCSDICLLKGTTYSCACSEDRQLASDGHTCRDTSKKSTLIIASNSFLLKLRHQRLGKPEIMSISTGFQTVTALAYNALNGEVFVADSGTRSIESFDINTHESRTTVSKNLGVVSGMDFDYFTNSLYWCDSTHKIVEVFSLNTHARKTIMANMEGETPLDIALVPEEGIMFVAFKKAEKGVHIDRFHMDGRGGRTHVIENGLIGPVVNLVYDAELARIFWSDSGTGSIESTSIDGDDRHGFMALKTAPLGLAAVGKDLFWTNIKSRKIYWADKHNSEEGSSKYVTLDIAKNVEHLHLLSAGGIRVVTHPCLSANNNGCTGLCLQSHKESICDCPTGLVLSSDNRTCLVAVHCSGDEFRCNSSQVCLAASRRCDGTRDCDGGEDEADCASRRPRCPPRFFECTNGDCVHQELVCDLRYDCKDKSDEAGCEGFAKGRPVTCPERSFRCQSGNCIADHFVCDGTDDCPDGSDETNCKIKTCSSGNFQCLSGDCIPNTWVCDGEIDCSDYSDESNDCGPLTCGPNKFTCTNGRCIDKSLECDSNDDCGDLSDEMSCKKEKSDGCGDGEFLCANTTVCVPESSRCNKTEECPNGVDETGCSRCRADEFECTNKKCIAQSWVCDESDDCGDKSDELPELCDKNDTTVDSGSSHELKPRVELPCEKGFRCKTGHCIDMELVCNEEENCYDGSDENGACATACTPSSNPCTDRCLKTPSGPRCACRDGFVLQGDGRTCADVNECQSTPPICSQSCSNFIGSFTCSCFKGYVLRADRKSCKATGKPMSIVFTSGSEIRRLTQSINTLELIYSDNSPKVSGIATNSRTGHLYFSIEELGSIYRLDLAKGSKDTISDVGRPQRLALDWIADNIYYVDSSSKTIGVCHIGVEKCAKVLDIETQGGVVSAFAIDGFNGFMFYAVTSWRIFNAPKSTVYKAHLDGSEVAVLTSGSLGHISGMALDPYKRVLYTADQFFSKAEQVFYDGSSQSVVLKTSSRPTGLAVFEDHLYFLQPNGMMAKCRIFGVESSSSSCESFKLHVNTPELFAVVQEAGQPKGRSICEGSNCTHMCLPSGDGARCVCDNGATVPEGTPCDIVASPNEPEMKPTFSTVSRESSVESSNLRSTLIGVLITVICAAFAIALFTFVRKKKLEASKCSFDTMRFHNPTFGMGYLLETASSVQPGQHEYTNPLNLKTFKADQKEGEGGDGGSSSSSSSKVPNAEITTPSTMIDI